MSPGQRLADLRAKLDEVEAELKSIGFWSEGPAPARLGSYLDMPFETWLQWVFLPTARAWLAEGAPAKRSWVGLMALRQYDYHSVVEEALGLVRLLNAFDELAESDPDA
jgi:uncharacterized protein YqcC (DUF446 family)